MAYTVNRTSGLNPIIVEDGTVNQTTDLDIPGKNTTSYGINIAENFIRLLENFANNSEPANPIEGQLWYDTSAGVNQLKIYNDPNWAPAGGLHKGNNQPTVGAVLGDLWVDTDNQQLYLFTGAGWILVGPEFSQGLNTGSKPTTITGTDNLPYNVVLFEVDAKPVAIISTKSFTPKASIQGFSTILPGLNLSFANIESAGVGKFYGTAQKAESLIAANNEVVAGSNFLRKDKANIADFNLKINNNTGIDIGNSATINLGIEGTAGIMSHRTSGASLFFRVNDQGTTRTVLSIDSNTNVGINTTAPSEALEVIGNVKTSGKLFVDDVTNSNSINTGSALFKGGVGIAKKLYVGEESEFGNDVTVKGNIIPGTNDLYNLGASDSLRFDTVYTRELRASNINVASITGNLTGSAQQANKLTSQTTFQMSGDVTSAVVNFDGSTGGLSKIFTTAISNTFIANKTATGTSQNSDEILLNRVSGTTGVFKISRDNLFDAIAKMPTGMITPFGGSSAPTHWLLCDGEQYVIGTYPELYAVIGSSFGTATAGYFRVPDLRGRMPLGKDNMGGTSANRVTATAADSVGGFGGDESKVIPVTNLPDHEHDLQGAAGAQYYAVRDVPGIGAGETTAITYDAPTGSGQGSALPSSGGVLSGSLGNAQDVMNPFTTVNYIIYTGQSN